MPFGEPAGGIGLCYKETVPYKCWELGLKGRVRGVWTQSTWSQNKYLNSERRNGANGSFCLCGIGMPGWPGVHWATLRSKEKQSQKALGAGSKPEQRGKLRHSRGEGRLFQGPNTNKKDRTWSDLWYQQPQGTPPNWQAMPPSWYFYAEKKKKPLGCWI